MADDFPYLDPSFDASKLTKPQLRSILGDHGVTNLPAANAKKEVLLEIFEKEVRGKAGEILKGRKAVRASAKGITFLDNQSHPSPKMSPKASPKSQSLSRSRSRSRSPVKKLKLAAMESSSSLPSVKSDFLFPAEKKRRGRPKKQEDEPKRPKSRSKSVVRKPAVNQPDVDAPFLQLQQSLPERTDSPRSATVKLQRRLDYIATANKMELAKEALQPVYADSPSRMKGIKSSSNISKRLLSAIASFSLGILKFSIIFILTIFLGVYLRWKFIYTIPYCDSGAAKMPFYPDVDLTTSLRTLCLTCPEHGRCSGGKLVCDEGHVRKSNWIMFGDSCQPDWKRFSKAEDLVKTIKLVLRERQGAFQCKQCATPTIPEHNLKSILKSSRFHRASWAGEDFESYYSLALLDLIKDPQNEHGLTIMGGASEGQQRLFLSKIAKFSWRCQIYLLASQFYQTYRYHLGISLIFLALVLYFYFKLKKNRWERRKVDELVQTVLQCLAEQDALNRRDPTRPSTLSVPQLRDALFMHTSASDKATLWPKVCAAIANNSNVRESVMSIKGEQHRVWEWIGMDVLAPFTKLSGV